LQTFLVLHEFKIGYITAIRTFLSKTLIDIHRHLQRQLYFVVWKQWFVDVNYHALIYRRTWAPNTEQLSFPTINIPLQCCDVLYEDDEEVTALARSGSQAGVRCRPHWISPTDPAHRNDARGTRSSFDPCAVSEVLPSRSLLYRGRCYLLSPRGNQVPPHYKLIMLLIAALMYDRASKKLCVPVTKATNHTVGYWQCCQVLPCSILPSTAYFSGR
jgi:hypothetical protein